MVFDNNGNIIAEQRLLIYTFALHKYQYLKEHNCNEGICACLKGGITLVSQTDEDLNIFDCLPEFQKIKKEFGKGPDTYWWKRDFDRIPFFKTMIKETEQIILNK
jgi:hypothetical protein